MRVDADALLAALPPRPPPSARVTGLGLAAVSLAGGEGGGARLAAAAEQLCMTLAAEVGADGAAAGEGWLRAAVVAWEVEVAARRAGLGPESLPDLERLSW
jgi:hypothetical protein